MNYPPVVYLSGPMNGLPYDDANGWRELVRNKLRPTITVSSPMRGKEELEGKVIGGESYDPKLDPLVYSPPAIVTRDRLDVSQCDLMLVNLLHANRVSIGTMVELGWADAWRKPVVGVRSDRSSYGKDHPHIHPFLDELLTYETTSLLQAVALIKRILEPYA